MKLTENVKNTKLNTWECRGKQSSTHHRKIPVYGWTSDPFINPRLPTNTAFPSSPASWILGHALCGFSLASSGGSSLKRRPLAWRNLFLADLQTSFRRREMDLRRTPGGPGSSLWQAKRVRNPREKRRRERRFGTFKSNVIDALLRRPKTGMKSSVLWRTNRAGCMFDRMLSAFAVCLKRLLWYWRELWVGLRAADSVFSVSFFC